jgi:hypothetical protein
VIYILKLAYTYRDKLQPLYQQIIFQEKYKFYNFADYWDYELDLIKSSWEELAFVSVDNDDNIIGFLRAGLQRNVDKVSSLGILNFGKPNITFSKDLYQFLTDLFEKYNFRKIEFNMIVGNPIEKMYDKYINKYGGNIIGIKKKSTKLQDGQYYDVKQYEIFKEQIIL